MPNDHSKFASQKGGPTALPEAGVSAECSRDLTDSRTAGQTTGDYLDSTKHQTHVRRARDSGGIDSGFEPAKALVRGLRYPDRRPSEFL